MSCLHPSVAQFFDRQRGTMTCSLCGEVINDQQLELDPAFGRGERPAGGTRHPPGFARPMRSTILSNPASHRPSIEKARRIMQDIARQLEISNDHVEMAASIFKLAVNNNVVSGSRTSVLCGCLYAVCRRENTPHMIYDFADATKESPYIILGNMKLVCRATNTQVPPPDPSFYIQRMSNELNLGPKTEEIIIMTMKIIRVMHSEWFGYGRRPLGLCGAAILVAANAFGVTRSVEDIVKMIRLSSSTILIRLGELMSTSVADGDIDAYIGNDGANAPAFTRGRCRDGQYERDNTLRTMSAMYYQLVNEAKASTPATSERIERWSKFLRTHCAENGIPLNETFLALDKLTPAQQLRILGLSNAIVIDECTVKKVKEQTKQLMCESASPFPSVVTSPTTNRIQSFDALGGGYGEEEDEFSFGENRIESQVLDVKQMLEKEIELQNISKDAEELVIRSNFEVLVLPSYYEDYNFEWSEVRQGRPEAPDIQSYIINNQEIRESLKKVNIQVFGEEKWNAGAPRDVESIRRVHQKSLLDDGQTISGKSKRGRIKEHATVASALKAALRNKGAGQIDIDAIFNEEDVCADEEWPADVA